MLASTGCPASTFCRPRCSASTRWGRWSRTPVESWRRFGDVVDLDQVLEIEPGRFLTFEYIGPDNLLGEARGGIRTRGANCTSVDAAFLHRARDGVVELVLMEWKYTESYSTRDRSASSDEVRRQRYEKFVRDSEGPVRDEVLDFQLLLDEPFYQLMRQQLLA